MSIRASVLQWVADAFPALTYALPRTYVVAGLYPRGDARVDVVPPPGAADLRELRGVPVWTLGGAVVLPVLGAEVLVWFRDGDRTRPVVVAWAYGPVTRLDLGGGGGSPPGVARVGDEADCGTLTIATVGPAVAVTYTPPGGGTPLVWTLASGAGTLTATPVLPFDGTAPIEAVITTGSSKVSAED